MENIQKIGVLNIYFTLLSVDCLPEKWAELVIKIKNETPVFIQFFNNDCLVGEMIPLLVYNVHQAFKYGYNLLKGFEQELLVVLYGHRSFQKASSLVGVSTCQRAAILLISEEPEALKNAVSLLKEEFSKTGVNLKPFQEDVSAFTLFWKNLLSKEMNIDTERLGYSDILNLVKERMALIYI